MQHRENTPLEIEKNVMILPEFPRENVAENLSAMEISTEDGGFFVPLKRAQTVRTALTQIKKYTGKSFETNGVDFREDYPLGGINFWRVG